MLFKVQCFGIRWVFNNGLSEILGSDFDRLDAFRTVNDMMKQLNEERTVGLPSNNTPWQTAR